MSQVYHQFVFQGGAQGAMRLDKFLSASIGGLSKTKAKEVCERKGVLVNGEEAAANLTLATGDRVEVVGGLPVTSARPEAGALAGPLDIVYEDENLLVVNKPRAMHSVTLCVDDPPTLADAIANYCPSCLGASPDSREAGLLQRLDFFTTGLAMAAKNRDAWLALRAELFEGRVRKNYRAIVEGAPDKKTFEIKYPIETPKDAKKVVVRKTRTTKEVVSANTQVRLIKVLSKNPLISEVIASGARMCRHQVRAHLAAAGHPLVGDTLYGSKLSSAQIMPADSGEIGCFMLHAESIALVLPWSEKKLSLKVKMK